MQLHSNDALGMILGHLRVAGWKDTDVLGAIFAEQVRVARVVPCYRLTLPWGAGGLEAAAKLAMNLFEREKVRTAISAPAESRP